MLVLRVRPNFGSSTGVRVSEAPALRQPAELHVTRDQPLPLQHRLLVILTLRRFVCHSQSCSRLSADCLMDVMSIVMSRSVLVETPC